ncbi:MAG: protein kinase [Planctomycetota bacterium]
MSGDRQDRLSLLMRHGPKQGLRVLLPGRGRIVIGRDPACKLSLDDNGLSREHCVIETSHENACLVRVADLGSRNGTWVNRRRIDEPTTMLPGDRLYIGNVVLELQQRRSGTSKEVGEETRVFEANDIIAAAAADQAAYERTRPTGSEDYPAIDFESSNFEMPSTVVQDGALIDALNEHTQELVAFRERRYGSSQHETEELVLDEPGSDVRDYGIMRIGPWRLVELLYDGPLCPVFRVAHDIMLNPYALKLLPKELAANEPLVRRFRHEAQVTSRFDHDNIRRLVNAGESGGNQFLVFDFVDGPDLHDHVEYQGVLDVASALRMAHDIASAAITLHANKVVHRNIMPGSVLIDVDGTAVLSDLGLSDSAEKPGAVDDLLDEDTAAFELAFRAPELFSNTPRTSPLVDVYGIGATLRFALTGRAPFDHRKPDDLLRAIGQDTPTPLGKLLPSCPAGIVSLVQRCLSKEPSARPGSARELADAIESLIDEL